MVSLVVVFVILFSHWFGDFYCQTSKMAANKSKSLAWLTAHCLTYIAVIGATLFLPYITYKPLEFLLFLLINFALHMSIDAVTSRITAYLYQRNRIHDFFVVIGFDQFLHYACLFTTYVLLLDRR